MNMAMRAAWIRHLRKAQTGVAAIEFAILAPLLVLLLIGIVEVGLASYEALQVQSAAEAGALYAAKNGWNSNGIETAVVNATGASGITATPAPQTFCGCPQASGISTTSCSATCPGGTSPGQYVEVDAALTHEPILPFPGFPSPLVLKGKFVLRLN